MTLYQLYLESGPRRKKTMVHVLVLLGCIATGPTTEEALERTPKAIGDYLRFLQRHGTVVDMDANVRTQVAEHITEGIWLGNGDPSIVFQPDLEPLIAEDAEEFFKRMEWMRSEVIDMVGGLSEEQLEEKPQPKGRSVKAILEHILESEFAYMRTVWSVGGATRTGCDCEETRWRSFGVDGVCASA